MADMTEEDRGKLYGTLLRGIADEAQDRLCAADEQHDWSPWHRTALKPDVPMSIRPPGQMPANDGVRIKSERRCLNCGKSEIR